MFSEPLVIKKIANTNKTKVAQETKTRLYRLLKFLKDIQMKQFIYTLLLGLGLTFSLLGCGGSSVEATTQTEYDIPLLWEAAHPEGDKWSNYLLPLIEQNYADTFLPGTSDIKNFCPKYHNLNNTDRIQFWGYLISAVTQFESAFDPTSRMSEPSLGKDKITKNTVYSEGLLQLSYQDAGWIPNCEINWEKDKHLAPRDPKKTILNPYINLNCGTWILANQIRNRNQIAVSSGVYWAVLRPGHPRLTSIQALTRKMPGCI